MDALEIFKSMEQPVGKKLDTGKVPVMNGVFLRFPLAMTEVAKVSALGAEKYEVPITDSSFLTVPDGFRRYTDALGRHLLEHRAGHHVNVEKGGGLPPEGREVLALAQVAWNALAALEIFLTERK